MNTKTQKLANLILDHSLKVKDGDKVVLAISDFTELELVQNCYEGILIRGAIPYLDVMGMNLDVMRADFGEFTNLYFKHATQSQLSSKPEIYEAIVNWADKFIRLVAIHDKAFLKKADSNKISIQQQRYLPYQKQILSKPWILSYLPTQALAEASEMTIDEFCNFYYQATITDYAQMDSEIMPLEKILDKGKQVTIISPNTNLTLDISGRLAMGRGNGIHNIPDGECFIAPVENKTAGHIFFELPQIYNGQEVEGIYLEFSKGKVVDFKAGKNQKLLESLISSHEGNRILGELGIGMNRNITKYIKDILFDEKIYGTIHLALGSSLPYERGGGKNQGSIHWDMIKDLRQSGTEVKVDDRVIMKNGEILV